MSDVTRGFEININDKLTIGTIKLSKSSVQGSISSSSSSSNNNNNKERKGDGVQQAIDDDFVPSKEGYTFPPAPDPIVESPLVHGVKVKVEGNDPNPENKEELENKVIDTGGLKVEGLNDSNPENREEGNILDAETFEKTKQEAINAIGWLPSNSNNNINGQLSYIDSINAKLEIEQKSEIAKQALRKNDNDIKDTLQKIQDFEEVYFKYNPQKDEKGVEIKPKHPDTKKYLEAIRKIIGHYESEVNKKKLGGTSNLKKIRKQLKKPIFKTKKKKINKSRKNGIKKKKYFSMKKQKQKHNNKQ